MRLLLEFDDGTTCPLQFETEDDDGNQIVVEDAKEILYDYCGGCKDIGEWILFEVDQELSPHINRNKKG